jgi:hypothetical protein
MNVGSTSVNRLTCFAGRSLWWMLGHSAQIGKRLPQIVFPVQRKEEISQRVSPPKSTGKVK